jgi:hypothetical protein
MAYKMTDPLYYGAYKHAEYFAECGGANYSQSAVEKSAAELYKRAQHDEDLREDLLVGRVPYVDFETGELRTGLLADFNRPKPQKVSKKTEDKQMAYQNSNRSRQYSTAEKKMHHIGIGSTLSKNPAGREKQIRKMCHNDPKLIQSYKLGRAKGLEQKQNYLKKQRSNRSG